MYSISKDQLIKDQIVNIASYTKELKHQLSILDGCCRHSPKDNQECLFYTLLGGDIERAEQGIERALRAIIALYAEQTQGAPQDAEILRLMG